MVTCRLIVSVPLLLSALSVNVILNEKSFCDTATPLRSYTVRRFTRMTMVLSNGIYVLLPLPTSDGMLAPMSMYITTSGMAAIAASSAAPVRRKL